MAPMAPMASPRSGEEGPQAPSSSSRKVVGKLMPNKSVEVAKPHRLRLPGQGSVQGMANDGRENGGGDI